jgi:hypothetical protein
MVEFTDGKRRPVCAACQRQEDINIAQEEDERAEGAFLETED